MIDQLIIGKKASFDDFEASVKERKISAPKKKIIKETVPFSNQTYDFSKINGELYWEERSLEYVLEITALTPESLEEKRQEFADWVMNVMDEEIHDPFIFDYHFKGTFDDISYEDEVEKTTITVTFAAYPYMISNKKKEYSFDISVSEKIEAKIKNNSSHRIMPTLISDIDFTLYMNGMTYGAASGEVTDENLMFEAGENIIELQAASGSGTVRIEFHEEVF